ncbi:MAG TPA: hypothetical protein VL137_18005, partial [Polyangiaceae bacterium]|nr:hypothetical protein [Polyangiaceae bacterium]
ALPQQLLDRGARFVQVCDTQNSKSTSEREATRQLRYSLLAQTEAELQDHSFDFGVIENLNACPNPQEALFQLARVVSTRGSAVIGVPSPQAALQPNLEGASSSSQANLGYYELYDHVAEHFNDVRMLGQLPFVGYAIADFSAEREADVSVDTGFMPGGAEEPQWFWALASHEPVVGEAFAIVQLPLAGFNLPPVSAPQQSTEAVAVQGNQQQVSDQQAKLTAHIAQLETELQSQRQAALNASSAAAATSASSAASTQALKDQIAALGAQISQRDAQLALAKSERTALDARLAQLKGDLEELRNVPGSDQPVERSEEALADLNRLEGLLQERAAVVQRLEQQLAEAERVVGDLVRELDSSRQNAKPLLASVATAEPPAEVAQLQTRLDNLALANAERAALLATAEATIRELEHRLASASADSALPRSENEILAQPAQQQPAQQTAQSTELPS